MEFFQREQHTCYPWNIADCCWCLCLSSAEANHPYTLITCASFVQTVVKYHKCLKGKSGAFQHRADHQSVVHHQLPSTWTRALTAIKYENCSELKLCRLFFLSNPQLNPVRRTKSVANKGEDFAPVSVAGLAHISGPAGLKTTESHWRTEQEKDHDCFLTSSKLFPLIGHNDTKIHQKQTGRQQD